MPELKISGKSVLVHLVYIQHFSRCKILLQVFTEEQKQEMHNVQYQIKRRVSIGGFVSEIKLMDELKRVGLDEMLIRRALLYLVTCNEFEYVKERRLVHRLQ